MNTILQYKGYTTQMEYSEEDGCFIGRLESINDVIVFHGYSVAEFETIFEEAVDDYLLTCQEFNRPPQKPAKPLDSGARFHKGAVAG